VDADRNASSICEAIAAGRVRVVSRPISWSAAAAIMTGLLVPSLGLAGRSPQPASASV
jgi:hypothetical protein